MYMYVIGICKCYLNIYVHVDLNVLQILAFNKCDNENKYMFMYIILVFPWLNKWSFNLVIFSLKDGGDVNMT